MLCSKEWQAESQCRLQVQKLKGQVESEAETSVRPEGGKQDLFCVRVRDGPGWSGSSWAAYPTPHRAEHSTFLMCLLTASTPR